MKIEKVLGWREEVPLTRPYTIARATYSSVTLFFLRIEAEDGSVGLGSASPAKDVTGEDPASTEAALRDLAPRTLRGGDLRALGTRLAEARAAFAHLPSVLAAADMALHDLFARRLGIPLVDLFGRVHESLPTSITIGIKDEEATLLEADEYLGRGFDHFKVKLGLDVDQDIARLTALRQRFGDRVRLRVDANEGYDLAAARALFARARDLDLELVEQPFARGAEIDHLGLMAEHLPLLALDESVHGPEDAARALADPARAGIHVIKLMKCGGLDPARRIAALAEASGTRLMWGCMDESVLSISAALHLALASRATRYLDLDGSLDLASDPFAGGFVIEAGRMRLAGGPGLGVTVAEGGRR